MIREELLLGLAGCRRSLASEMSPEDARASMERFLLRFIDDEDVADAYGDFMAAYMLRVEWANETRPTAQ